MLVSISDGFARLFPGKGLLTQMVLTGTGLTIPVEILSYELSEVMSCEDQCQMTALLVGVLEGKLPALLAMDGTLVQSMGLWNFWLWKPVSSKSQNRNEYMVGTAGFLPYMCGKANSI